MIIIIIIIIIIGIDASRISMGLLQKVPGLFHFSSVINWTQVTES